MAGLAIALALGAVGGAWGQDPGGLKTRLDAIVGVQDAAYRRFAKELEGRATEEAQKPAYDRYERESALNADEALDLALTHPGDPAAVEALRFVIETVRAGPSDQSYRAMELLLKDHVRAPGMGRLCGKIFYFGHSPTAEALLLAVAEGHPGREDRGLACQSLAYLLAARAKMVRDVRAGTWPVDRYVHDSAKEATTRLIERSDPEALDRESDGFRERIIAEYADVKDWFTPRRTLGAIAEGELFARRNLREGQVAPEVVGKDHRGRPFALGDYRGKVVVLTFGATWCGPCVGMFPKERELVAKLAGRDFALVGVNADEDLATLRKSIDSGEITWRCWWDGGMDGPITTRWGVIAIPAVFVLDRAGVIRKKDVRGDDLEKVVMDLLDEKPAGPVAPK